MSKAHIPIVSFISGEWSPRLFGRIDIGKYKSACKKLENMIIWPHGGATRRPGLEYVADAKVMNYRPQPELRRLIPFEFNVDQSYVLEFGHQYIRFYRDGAQILDGSGNPLEIPSPFFDNEVKDIGFTQSSDVMYLVHPRTKPQKLARTGVDTFTLSDVTFTAQPAEWSGTNYPGIVTFYQQRLCFSGCPSDPQSIWLSKNFDYTNFTIGANDDDAMRITLASDQVNAINWMISAKELLVGTTGGEWIVGPGNGAALTPTNLRAERQSKNGSRKHRALLIGNSAIYISRDKKKIREMRYDLQADSFTSPDLSLLAEHIPRKQIKEIHHKPTPDSIIWLVLEDGSFAGVTYLKDQDVIAWHRHKTDGIVRSMAVIEEADQSQLWLAVEREGQIRIEVMAQEFDGDSSNDYDCFYVDAGLRLESETTFQNLSGLDHLEGKTVSILADGYSVPPREVVDGSITLDRPANIVQIGLPYEWRITPMNIEGGSPAGISQTKRRRILEVTARLDRSLGIKYQAGEGEAYDLVTRTSDMPLGVATELFTGDKPMQLASNWSREDMFTLFGSDPFPVSILMLVVETVMNE